MARGRYHHGDLRSALLDAAEVLVRERGVEGWSLREVSLRVGVSPSAAYHHFASCDALVQALAVRVLAAFGARLATSCARARGRRGDRYVRLVAFGRSYVRWAVEDPAVARLVFATRGSARELVPEPHPHDVLAAELDRLVTSGGLAPSARAGAEFIVWAAVHGLAVLLLDGLVEIDGQRAVDAHAERVVRAVLHGLAVGSGAAGTPSAMRSAYTERRDRNERRLRGAAPPVPTG